MVSGLCQQRVKTATRFQGNFSFQSANRPFVPHCYPCLQILVQECFLLGNMNLQSRYTRVAYRQNGFMVCMSSAYPQRNTRIYPPRPCYSPWETCLLPHVAPANQLTRPKTVHHYNTRLVPKCNVRPWRGECRPRPVVSHSSPPAHRLPSGLAVNLYSSACQYSNHYIHICLGKFPLASQIPSFQFTDAKVASLKGVNRVFCRSSNL